MSDFKMESTPESAVDFKSEQNDSMSEERDAQYQSSNYAREREEDSSDADKGEMRDERSPAEQNEGEHSATPAFTHTDHLKSKDSCIEQLEELESQADAGAMFLKKLMSAFEPMADSNPEVRKFIEDSTTLLEKRSRPQINIGVYGVTGAGKSSLLNALLNQNILHTNAMEVGTQTVIVVSYNENDDSSSRFRADIETISFQEWRAELKVLFEDIKDVAPGEIEDQDEKSDAGMARDKLKAVYPDINLDDMAKISPELLNLKASHKNMFGITHHFKATNSRQLNKEMESFLTSSSDEKGHQKPAFWPLVRECRFYVKNPLLKCGINLVDLPGCGDSNAARSMRAEEYRKKIQIVFVAAQIHRAIDDKTAQDLLDKNFQRQAQLDGLLDGGRMTFVMTKSDDINMDEVLNQRHMKQRADVKEIIKEQNEDKVMKKSVEDGILDLERELNNLSGPQKKFQDAINSLRAKIKENGTSSVGKKSAQTSSTALALKKGKISNLSLLPGKKKKVSPANGGQIKRSEKKSESTRPDTSSSSLQEKLKKLITQRDALTRKRTKLKKEIQFQIDSIAEFKDRIKSYDDVLRGLCIKERNAYLIKAFKRRWSHEIQEIRCEFAADDGDEEPTLSASALVKSLPVFCVSAKAFHQLVGRNKREGHIPGFANEEDTGIPQLREHCREASVPARYANVEIFLTELDILARKMVAWAEDNTPEIQITPHQADMIEKIYNELCSKFKKDHTRLIDQTVTEVYSPINKHIPSIIQKAADQASQTMPKVLDALFDPKSDSFMHFLSFRAACRKQGDDYKTTRGLIFKLNEIFAEPFLTVMAPTWDKVFNRLIPPLAKSHHEGFVQGWANLRGTFIARVSAINEDAAKRFDNILTQPEHMERRASTEFKEVFDAFNMSTRGINRIPKRCVKSKMIPAYDLAAQEKGKGSKARVREATDEHVKKIKKSVFEEARKNMVSEISNLRQDFSQDMEDIYDAEMKKVRRDVTHILKIGKAASKSKLVRLDKRELQALITMHVLDLKKAWNGVPVSDLIFGDMAGPPDEPLKIDDDALSDEENILLKDAEGVTAFTKEQIKERLGSKGDRRYESDDEYDLGDDLDFDMVDVADAELEDEYDGELIEDEDMEDDFDGEFEEED